MGNKNIFVVGGTTSIGKNLVEQLLSPGNTLTLVGRELSRLDELKKRAPPPGILKIIASAILLIGAPIGVTGSIFLQKILQAPEGITFYKKNRTLAAPGFASTVALKH